VLLLTFTAPCFIFRLPICGQQEGASFWLCSNRRYTMQSTKHRERMKETICSTGGRSTGAHHLAWFLWTIGNGTECRRLLLRRASRNNLFLFSFVSSRTTQDKNGVSTWRDHQFTRVYCVTHSHSSRFVAYTASLVLFHSADFCGRILSQFTTRKYDWF
jgi:hypothetical protein